MKRFLKLGFLLVGLSACTFLFAFYGWHKRKFSPGVNLRKAKMVTVDHSIQYKLSTKAGLLYNYAVKKGFNTRYFFMADMSIASGRKRFFIYDRLKDSVVKAAVVTHGNCNESWLKGRRYSNEIGGGCTALGRYKVGKSYNGKFGLAYKLYGLDSSNNNAYNRFVVLHAHDCVPEEEVHPAPVCQSLGCPTVSPGFLIELRKFIDGTDKPILLWIYDDEIN